MYNLNFNFTPEDKLRYLDTDEEIAIYDFFHSQFLTREWAYFLAKHDTLCPIHMGMKVFDLMSDPAVFEIIGEWLEELETKMKEQKTIIHDAYVARTLEYHTASVREWLSKHFVFHTEGRSVEYRPAYMLYGAHMAETYHIHALEKLDNGKLKHRHVINFYRGLKSNDLFFVDNTGFLAGGDLEPDHIKNVVNYILYVAGVEECGKGLMAQFDGDKLIAWFNSLEPYDFCRRLEGE